MCQQLPVDIASQILELEIKAEKDDKLTNLKPLLELYAVRFT